MDDLAFSLLGPMRGQRAGGPLELGSPQQRAMLAALLLRPGRTARAADLIDALWGDDPPRAAMTTVRTYAWRLRKLLERDPATPRVLVSLGDGYQLVFPDGAVDVRRAEELASRAEHMAEGGRLEPARDLLNQSLSLWRGEPLFDVPGPHAAGQRHRLTELRLILLEERIGLDLALGRATRCVPELAALAAEHPLRERLHGLLMRALYQTGRQADALSAYHAARRLLADELGVQPGPDLKDLHRRILQGDPALAAPAAEIALVRARRAAAPADDTEPPRTSREDRPWPNPAPAAAGTPVFLPQPAQLPPDTIDFTGRTAVVERMCAALTATPGTAPAVVTVGGMSGVGKTGLALHVAHRVRESFPDGQLFAELGGGQAVPADPGTVLSDFLTALGVPATSLPDSTRARAGLFRSLVDRRRMLVVLDDVMDPEQIRSLLPGTASCAVLVTSRTRMAGLSTSLKVELEGLPAAEAVELLGRVVGAHRVAAEPDEALRLVAACGHLPLALRIVAARLVARPAWSVSTLCARLADEPRRIDELRVGALAVGATFELAYRALTPAQARAFRLVCAVDGPTMGLAAASSVLAMDEYATEELLESLVDVAMLGSSAVRRYLQHDLLRDFGRSKSLAQQPDQTAAALARLLDFQLATARAAFQHAVPDDPVGGALGCAHTVGLSFPDLAAARAWAAEEVEAVLSLVAQTARAAQPGNTRGLRSAIDLAIAFGPLESGPRYGQFLTAARALLQSAVRCGDRRAEGRANFLCGHLALATTRLDEAEAGARQAVAVSRETNDTVILRQAVNDLGVLTHNLGRLDEAVGYYDQAIALARQLGHQDGEAISILNAAVARVDTGRAAEAAAMCRRLLTDPPPHRAASHTAYAHYVLALALHGMARYEEAVVEFRACLTTCVSAGLPRREAPARFRLADTLIALGRPEQALEQAELAVRLCVHTSYPQAHSQALLTVGRALQALGRIQEAHRAFQDAHERFRRHGLPEADMAARLVEAVREAASGPAADTRHTEPAQYGHTEPTGPDRRRCQAASDACEEP